MTALGLNEHNTITATCAIKGSSILQHSHLLNIVGRDIGKHIIELAVMQRDTVALHIHLDAVDDDEGLGITGDAIQTADEHRSTSFDGCRVKDATDIAA